MSLPAPEPVPTTTDDVVAWLLGPGHHEHRGEDGRPLGEQGAAAYRDVPRREEVRSFGDARDATGLPCNIAALMQLKGTWPVLEAALSSFEADAPATLGRAFRRAQAGARLAPLVALRTGEPVPRELAALYKVTLGFGEITAAMLLEERADADDAMPDVHELDAFLDERPWLIGPQQVCAGTRAQIGRMWQALGNEGPEAMLSDWHAEWFTEAFEAFLELDALTAAAAIAARQRALAGASGEGDAECLRIYNAETAPRLLSATRRVPNASAAHPTLLFAADAVPSTLRSFIERTADGSAPLDDALIEAACPAARRVMRAVGRERPVALSVAAFARACA